MVGIQESKLWPIFKFVDPKIHMTQLPTKISYNIHIYIVNSCIASDIISRICSIKMIKSQFYLGRFLNLSRIQSPLVCG